ncbi:MAG TPA: DUF6491 family protein [Rhodanobacteraceae bacterium]|nr:DUF6491 family protein [Rhodanobacteraceae bacterium]
MKSLPFALIALGALGATGCASQPSQPAVTYTPLRPYSACMDITRIREWYVTGPKSLIVSSGPDYYDVYLRTRCTGVGTGGSVHFAAKNQVGRPRVCGEMGDVVYSSSGVPCPVQSVRPISRDQFRAMEEAVLKR